MSEPMTTEPGTEQQVSSVKWRAGYRLHTIVSVNKIWAVASDFCNLEWCSLVTDCVGLEGEGNTVGTVRRCTNNRTPELSWYSDERLLHISHEDYTFTYEIVDSSLGWKDYRATFSLEKGEGGDYVMVLKGEQSPQEHKSRDEILRFMVAGYSLFLNDLEAKARTLVDAPIVDLL